MALINCSECGKEVSNKAESCPNCGNPISPITSSAQNEEKLCCPSCGSSNLHSDKKGYSAGKAAAGVILTGGIGLLAGAIGSGDIKITCLKCGRKFKAGEGIAVKPIQIPEEISMIDKKLIELCSRGATLQAIKEYKDYSGGDLSSAKQYVDKLKATHNIEYFAPTPSGGGCYIATAVYGSYESPEVLVLRQYRDNVLNKTTGGRCFVRIYYKLSPPIANKMKSASLINKVVKNILDKFVAYLISK